ncbi:MAG: glycosyltransferase family 4 protein [Anaerolineae bacterium]
MTRPLKIALIPAYDYPYPGGVTRHITALAAGLRQRGHQVRIIAAHSGKVGPLPDGVIKVSDTIAPVPVAGSVARVALSPRLYRRVKAVLRRERFDVLHLHEPMTPALPWVVLRHQGEWPRSAVVGTFHGYREQLVRSWQYIRPLVQTLFDRLDNYIAVSPAARDYIHSYFPASYQVIPNGVDLSRFYRPPGLGYNGHRPNLNILFVGRLEKRKGFPYLLRAFRRVRAQLPQATLTVVGACDPSDIAPYRAEPGLTFVGYCPDEELPEYYRAADVFCAPSTGFESFGLVLLEAMATGLPVVASDIAGYRTVLTHGREGLLVPPRNAPALAEALLALLNNACLRAMMGRQGQQKARCYSWELVVEQVLDVYHSTIRRKLGGRAFQSGQVSSTEAMTRC